MHNSDLFQLPLNRQSACRLLLLLSWFLGLLIGIIYAYNTDPSILSLMRSALLGPVSIVGLLTVFALPFLITAFAVFISRPALLIPLAFLKGFFFSACAFSIGHAFFSAGWLLRFLLMFSDLVSVPALLWLWLRCMAGNRKQAIRDLLVFLIFSVIVGSIDYCLVSPYLALLFR